MLLVSINSCGARNFNENLCWRSNMLRFTRGGTRLPKCQGSEYQNQYLPLAWVSSPIIAMPQGNWNVDPWPNVGRGGQEKFLIKDRIKHRQHQTMSGSGKRQEFTSARSIIKANFPFTIHFLYWYSDSLDSDFQPSESDCHGWWRNQNST